MNPRLRGIIGGRAAPPAPCGRAGCFGGGGAGSGKRSNSWDFEDCRKARRRASSRDTDPDVPGGPGDRPADLLPQPEPQSQLLEALEEAEPTTAFDSPTPTPTAKRRGIAGVRRTASKWPWDDLGFEPRLLQLDDERVVVFVRATATGAGSGVTVERRTAHECSLRNGRLVRFKVYSDRDQALVAPPERRVDRAADGLANRL